MELAVLTRSVPAAWLDPATADDNLLATILDVLVMMAEDREG